MSIFFEVIDLAEVLLPEKSHEVNRGQLFSNFIRQSSLVIWLDFAHLFLLFFETLWELGIELLADFKEAISDLLLKAISIKLKKDYLKERLNVRLLLHNSHELWPP